MTSFEENYSDILQNIEAVVVRFYDDHPDLNDYQVDKVYEALTRLYKAKVATFPPIGVRLTEVELALALDIRAITDGRILGTLLNEDGGEDISEASVNDDESESVEPVTPEPVSPDEIIACLKRLRKSVKHWGKEGGRQGYLNYIKPFIFGATL